MSVSSPSREVNIKLPELFLYLLSLEFAILWILLYSIRSTSSASLLRSHFVIIVLRNLGGPDGT